MNDIQFLTEDLQGQSLSDQEIVLPYREALQALEILAAADQALLGWEGWVKHPDGRHGHAPSGLGTIALDQEAEEDWEAYVQRSIDFCRKTIEAEQRRWDANPEYSSLPLYFCLTLAEQISTKEAPISKVSFPQ